MERTRRGKIARLPRAIRTELNRRLDEGDPQKDLVVWLNSLPAVREALQRHFRGKPITPQNLSEWKLGGYRDWRAQSEIQEAAGGSREDIGLRENENETLPALADTLAHWLAMRLAAETRRIARAEGDDGWKRLRQFSRELATLRRGDFQKQRLELDRQREQRKAERVQPPKKITSSEPVDPKALPTLASAEEIAALRQAFFASVGAEIGDFPPPSNFFAPG